MCETDGSTIRYSDLASPPPECGQAYDSSSESEGGPVPETDLMSKYSELSKLEDIQVAMSSAFASQHEMFERTVGVVQNAYDTATPTKSVFNELESLSSRRIKTVPQSQLNSTASGIGDHIAGHGSSLCEELPKSLPTCLVYLQSQDSQDVDNTSDIQPSAASDIQPSATSSKTQPFSYAQPPSESRPALPKPTASSSISTQQRKYSSPLPPSVPQLRSRASLKQERDSGRSQPSVPQPRSRSSLKQEGDSGRSQPVEKQFSHLVGGTQAIMSKDTTRLRGAKIQSSSPSSVKKWKEKDPESTGDHLSSPDDTEDQWSDSLEGTSTDQIGSKFQARSSK